MTVDLEEERKRLEQKLKVYRQRQLRVVPDIQEYTSAEEDSDKADELQYQEKWTSGRDQEEKAQSNAPVSEEIQTLKGLANAHLKKGELSEAIKTYSAALQAAEASNQSPHEVAVLYSNRAVAFLREKHPEQAAEDAKRAIKLDPSWPKPHHRLAQALALLRRWEAALAACRDGAAKAGVHASEFMPLMDQIATQAALHGSLAGFNGRKLEVRDAGEEAWLGKQAPHDPLLDGPLDEDDSPVLALPAPTDDLYTGSSSSGAVGFVKKGFSFRSIHAAVAAARDGDQILLKKGIHNGLGETVQLNKRVLIRGEGVLGEARVDQRANNPAFRISRSCVMQGLDIDMTGFREAIKVEGATHVQPLIQDCIIRCSGDDAVNLCGKAEPVFQRCTIQAKKCGVRAYEQAAASFLQCRIEDCGEQGVKAFESAEITLCRCQVVDCKEDGVVAMESSRISLDACTISGCKGPAVDLTGRAQLHATDCTLSDCMGAVWAWEDSMAQVADCVVEADKTYVVLLDGNAKMDIKGCVINGKPYTAQKEESTAWQACNKVTEPTHHVGAPPEEGAFEFVPNQYTRKQ